MNKNLLEVVNITLKWCIEKFGSLNKHLPYIYIDENSPFSGFFMIYADNSSIISINPQKCNGILDIIDTVIHEYVHFTQFKDFWEFTSYSERRDAYEADACWFAEENRELCYSEIKKYINI